MDYGQHFNMGGLNLIQNTVGIKRQLADSLLVEFRHDVADARQIIEANGFADQGFSYTLGVKRGISRNILVDIAKLGFGVIGPLYHA